MSPEPPPSSNHTDLELTRLNTAAGYFDVNGWFVPRSARADLDLLLAHPQPPRPFFFRHRLRAEVCSFAGLGWLLAAAVLIWGLMVWELTTLGLGLLLLIMMTAFGYRTTRALRHGRLVLGTARKATGRATLITSSMDRLEIALPPGEPWPTVELELPPAPSRYLLERHGSFEVLLLALDRPENTRLVGFRAGAAERGEEATAADPR